MRTPAPLARALALAATVAVPAVAQDPAVVEAARAELERLRNELLHRQDEVQDLLYQRLRHDLGLPTEHSAATPPARPVRTTDLEDARVDLQQQERVSADLARRYERLQETVARLREQAAVREQETTPDWVAVPRPYTLPAADGGHAAPAGETRMPEEQGREAPQAREREPVASLLALDPVRGQIQGSRDPGTVARALYRAARDLAETAERLRSAGREGSAAEYDRLATERLLLALESLNAAVRVEEPAYIDLFYQGKCREALFRMDERHSGLSLRDDPLEYQRREQEVRDPFLAITVRDVEAKGEAEGLGRWGQAAQAALDHFRWMNLNGGFRPSMDPAEIWEGK